MKAYSRHERETVTGSRQDTLVKPRLRLIHGEKAARAGVGGATATSEAEAAQHLPARPTSQKSTMRGSGGSASVSSSRGSAHRKSAEGVEKANRDAVSVSRRARLAKSRAVTVVSAVALGFVVFAVVAGQVLLIQAGYSRSSAQKELDEARAEYEQARLEEAEARLPKEVEQRARGELGLTDAGPEQPLQMGPAEPPIDATSQAGSGVPGGRAVGPEKTAETASKPVSSNSSRDTSTPLPLPEAGR